jgi:hypothetical protein
MTGNKKKSTGKEVKLYECRKRKFLLYFYLDLTFTVDHVELGCFLFRDCSQRTSCSIFMERSSTHPHLDF